MWKWRLKHECHTCRKALCLPAIPCCTLHRSYHTTWRPSKLTVNFQTTLCLWLCYFIDLEHATPSTLHKQLLCWFEIQLSTPRPWCLNESIPSTIFSEHTVYFAPRALIYPALLLVAYLPITYRKRMKGLHPKQHCGTHVSLNSALNTAGTQ